MQGKQQISNWDENQSTAGIENKKNKRVLWLINHTTLREFEVPLLISLGYEVFTPKQIPKLIFEWSGSIDYQYDSTLSIPSNILEILNQHNFYTDKITPQIAQIINTYFGSAFCVFYPFLFKQIAKRFQGHVLLRAFGLDKRHTYSKFITYEFGKEFFKHLHLLGEKFWFSQAYSNLAEVESDVLKSRAITHPLGLSENFFKHKDTWVGTEKKILFFCSRINVSSDFNGKIYKAFKENLGALPHIIAGNQPTPVDDVNVMGFKPREIVESWFRDCAVMFYHSDEPRHLHYHPLEALVFGMPLVFMRGGMLERFGGADQPGACATYTEAKAKIQRILNNDELLITNILKQQQKILQEFTHAYNRDIWETNFTKKIICAKNTEQPEIKIGVFLPLGYKGGSLAGAKNIAKMLQLGSQANNTKTKVIFSCLENIYNRDVDFSDLLELGISIRETRWKLVNRDEVIVMQHLSGNRSPLYYEKYVLPYDGINNFNDCDIWLIISDRLNHPIAPIKPYGMVIYDYIQRYVPEILNMQASDNNLFSSPRLADFILCTTPSTREDILQYAGVSAEKVHLAPMEFEAPNTKYISNKNQDDNYFIWPTNTSQHNNHLCTLEALLIYYNEFDGQLNVVMTGANTEILSETTNPNPTPYTDNIKNFISKSAVLKQHIKIVGNLNRMSYEALLASAKFLLHPTIIDNGTFSVIEAAYLNIPSICSGYAQMHYINERFDLNLQFFDAYDPRSIAKAIKNMELNYQQFKTKLPSQESLEQYSYKNIASEFWQLFRSLI